MFVGGRVVGSEVTGGGVDTGGGVVTGGLVAVFIVIVGATVVVVVFKAEDMAPITGTTAFFLEKVVIFSTSQENRSIKPLTINI